MLFLLPLRIIVANLQGFLVRVFDTRGQVIGTDALPGHAECTLK